VRSVNINTNDREEYYGFIFDPIQFHSNFQCADPSIAVHRYEIIKNNKNVLYPLHPCVRDPMTP